MNNYTIKDLCTNIISDFKQPLSYLLPALLLTAAGVFLYKLGRRNAKISPQSILLIIYMEVLMQTAFLSREPGSRKGIDLTLFGTWGQSAVSHAYFVENIIMLIPFGILAPIVLKQMRKIRCCVLTGFMLSCAIEISQFITQRGYCQLDDFNHIIMDYSIHDAIEAGFNHVVFIIRKDIEKEFKEVIGDRIASICAFHDVTVDYAFQDINDIPGELPEGRTKPWGTGQAVLAAKKVIKTPFIVINADDYYGKEGFKLVHEYLVNGGKSCMAGFVLKNTLSDNGGVTRGICKMDEQNNLTEVVETKNIVKTVTGAEVDGVAVDVNSLVSMNMWGLTPDFLDVLEQDFKEFFEKEVPDNPLKAEYLIPIFIGELLEQGKMSVKVLKTNDTWYGMTYREDVAAVKDSFKKMLENGVYKADLFADL